MVSTAFEERAWKSWGMRPSVEIVFVPNTPLRTSKTWPHTLNLGNDGGNQMRWSHHR